MTVAAIALMQKSVNTKRSGIAIHPRAQLMELACRAIAYGLIPYISNRVRSLPGGHENNNNRQLASYK